MSCLISPRAHSRVSALRMRMMCQKRPSSDSAKTRRKNLYPSLRYLLRARGCILILVTGSAKLKLFAGYPPLPP